jgi:hypothetical protein
MTPGLALSPERSSLAEPILDFSTGATNIFAVDPIDATHPMGTFTAYSVPDIIEPEGAESFLRAEIFWHDFITQSLVTAPAAGCGIVGDLVVVSEGVLDPSTKTSKVFDVVWDPVNKLKTTEIPGRGGFSVRRNDLLVRLRFCSLRVRETFASGSGSPAAVTCHRARD